jgi:hypothetical protein
MQYRQNHTFQAELWIWNERESTDRLMVCRTVADVAQFVAREVWPVAAEAGTYLHLPSIDYEHLLQRARDVQRENSAEPAPAPTTPAPTVLQPTLF